MKQNHSQIKERPIPFLPEMVKAILEGRKTQTRRVMKPQPSMVTSRGRRVYRDEDFKKSWESISGTMEGNGFIDCPYGSPGDRLWVRETWHRNDQFNPPYEFSIGEYIYKADFVKTGDIWVKDGFGVQSKWKPSIYMPRAASRILLEITDIRVERVQDITRSDIRSEGLMCPENLCSDDLEYNYRHWYIDEWKKLWDSINAKRGYGWDVSPWVWTIEFKVANNSL